MPSLSTKIMPSYYLLLLIHKEYIQMTTFITGIKNIDKIYLNVKKINVFIKKQDHGIVSFLVLKVPITKKCDK